MGSTFSKIYFHFAFATKDRQPLISPELEPELFRYIGGIVRGEGGSLYAAGGSTDHIHLLVQWRHDVAPADLMRCVKSNSTKWIKRTQPALRDFHWQEGYGVFSVSYSQIGRVTAYLAKQHEHHKLIDFKEEYRKLLKAHGLEWNEQFVWK